MNHTITIRLGTPLLRPGLEVETQVSLRYLVPALRDLLDRVRDFNKGQKGGSPAPDQKGTHEVEAEDTRNNRAIAEHDHGPPAGIGKTG